MQSVTKHAVLLAVALSTASGCAWYRSIAKRFQPRPHIIAIEEAPEQRAQRAVVQHPVNVATNIGIEGDVAPPSATQLAHTVQVPANVVPPKRVVAERIALRPDRMFSTQKRKRTLSPKGKQELDRVANQLARYNAQKQLVNVAIVDYSESASAAQRRIELVREYLADKGLDRALVKTSAQRPAKLAHACKSKKSVKRPECVLREARMEVVIRKRT